MPLLQCRLIVRFKLDHVGIKLSLKQWCKFTNEERENLVNKNPVTLLKKIDIYKEYLAMLIVIRVHEDAKPMKEFGLLERNNHQPRL